MEEENEEDVELETSHSLKRRSGNKSMGRGGVTPPAAVEDEVLHQPRKNDRDRERVQQQQPPPPPPNSSSWDYFFQTDNIPGPTLADVDENSVEREEREEMERKMLEERARRKEMEEKAAKAEPVIEVVETVNELPPQPPPPEAAMALAGKRPKPVIPTEGKKKSGGSVSLVQIFIDLDDCFLKASESAHDVSRMLEATRLHYHSNFADKRGTLSHINWSSTVLEVGTRKSYDLLLCKYEILCILVKQ